MLIDLLNQSLFSAGKNSFIQTLSRMDTLVNDRILIDNIDQERSQGFSKGSARQRENLSVLRIVFQLCTPLQPFFLQGVCPGTLFTPPGYAPDIDIAIIGLDYVRRCISIVPQDE